MLDLRSGAMGFLASSGLLLAAPVWPDGCQPPDPGGTGGTGSAALCGNGHIDPGESCDGYNVGFDSCSRFGFAAGRLKCTSDCAGYDDSECTPAVCGNGIVEGFEECDGAQFSLLYSSRCVDIPGFVGGTITCSSLCMRDTSRCIPAVCGDGKIEGGEQCEGTVGSTRCQDLDWAYGLKYGSGELRCDGCYYDVRNCRPPPGCYPSRFGITCY